MPVKIGKKTYKNHQAAVTAIKKRRNPPSNADAYVATIERKQKKSK